MSKKTVFPRIDIGQQAFRPEDRACTVTSPELTSTRSTASPSGNRAELWRKLGDDEVRKVA